MAAQVGEPPTVTADETLSQPSTSAGTTEDAVMKEGEAEKDPSSDSDASIGWGDYEHRKDVIVKKLVICEQQMARMKVTAKFTRLKDYEKRKEAIKNRTDSEYLARVAAMEREVQKEQDKQRTHYELELEALERANEGENDFINRGYRDRLQYRKSQLIYDAKLKLNKILERIWKEDEVRADVRIFVGEDVPDEWLDEFVKTYVDEQEERENGPEAVRQRNLKRYRREAGESLDTGQSLSAILAKAEAQGHWANRPSLKPLLKRVYDEQEKRQLGRARRRQMEKAVEQRLKTISHKRIGRFFGNKSLFPPRERNLEPEQYGRFEDELVKMEDVERTKRLEKGSEKKGEKVEGKEKPSKEPEVITLNEEEMPQSSTTAAPVAETEKKRKRGKKAEEELRRREEEEKRLRVEEERRKEEAKLEMERQEQVRRKRLEKMELEKSEESASDEETLDLAATVRQGVRAILMTQGMPSSVISTQREKRVGRLKTALRTMLQMKREFSADPELKQARSALVDNFVRARKERPEGTEGSDAEENAVGDGGMEQRIRNSSLVRGLVRKSLKRPIPGGEWLDREGRARGAVEMERKRREQLSTYFSAMKKEQFRKPKKKAVESESEWEEEGKEKRKRKRKEAVVETIYVHETEEQKSNGKAVEANGLSEKEKAEKEKRLRDIRAVIEGRDPATIEESPKEKEKKEGEEAAEGGEEEGRREANGVDGKKKKNGRRHQKPVRRYSSGSEDEEEYGSQKKKRGYGSVPVYRLATRPQPRLRLQLSQERILKDLYRSGALRQRETYGEHIERLDRERRQRLLASLPSTSSGDYGSQEYGSRVHLLSPRSRAALDELPEEALGRLSMSERKAFLEGLPSTSRDCFESSEDGEGDYDESDEDEELSEGWELEEEEEREVKEEGEEEEEDSMEVDDAPEGEEAEAVKDEQMEEPRREEKTEKSPPSTVDASPLLQESKKKKAAPRMNGFSRTGTATAV